MNRSSYVTLTFLLQTSLKAMSSKLLSSFGNGHTDPVVVDRRLMLVPLLALLANP
jgi:hypothetical protein